MTDTIKEIRITRVIIPLKKPFITSLGPHFNAENIHVMIKTSGGFTGTGECSPFMTINGESVDTCFIVGQYLAKALKGISVLDHEGLHKKMDSVIYGNNSIKSAFDIAMYDVASQHAGLPLYQFLNGRKKSMQTDFTVSIGDPADMAAQAAEIKAKGFSVIKVKLGGSAEEDINRIKKIREAIGIELPIRIDANQGWNVSTAISILQALQQYNIQFCEEPIARWDYLNLPSVKKHSLIPIMADESCCDEHDAQRLITLKACDYFNIKTGKSAGIYKALKIIRLAEKANIYMQMGGFLESRIGFTAAAHLALSSDNFLFYDFDTPLMFTEDPVIGGIIYSNGTVTVPEKPGLGATMNTEFLNRMEYVVI